MKAKIFLSASLLAVGVAFAKDVTTDYVLGAMPISLAAGQTEVIIGVPWIEPGQGSEGIAVSNIVKTANLSVGDLLCWYDTNATSWKFWRLTNGANDVKYWQSVVTSNDESGFSATDASETALKRGEAVLLNRRSGTTPATTIYVVGQYSAAATDTITLPRGKTTLIAPPRDTATDLNSRVTWTNVTAGDQILVQSGSGASAKIYVWDSSLEKWGSQTVENFEFVFTAGAVVPAGHGAFFKAAAQGNTPTVTWWAAAAE